MTQFMTQDERIGQQMRIRLFMLATAMAFLCAWVAQATPVRYHSATVPIEAGRSVTLSSAKGPVYLRSHTTGPTMFGMSEQRYRFTVGSAKKPMATAWVTVRTLDTGSRVVFARLSSPAQSVPLTMTLSTDTDTYSMHPFNIKASSAYSTRHGIDRTSGPWGWVELGGSDATTSSVFVSKAYGFRTLRKNYGHGKSSSAKLLLSERNLLSVDTARNHLVNVNLGLSATKASCERYFLLEDGSIVDTNTPKALVSTVTATDACWLDPTGCYEKGPYSIEPETRDGYVRSLLDMRSDDVIDAYAHTGSPFMEDLLLNDVYSLGLIRSADGLWRTNYTSTWVKSESHIVAPYVDTRHNEGIALSSARIADLLTSAGVVPADGIRAWGSPYASFLSRRAAAGAVIRTAHGFYFSDYYDASGKARCHASLNHSLGEMNYLLVRSGDSSSTPQFALAMKIKSAIDDTGRHWIRPNSDLWYQRNLNGKFQGTDYPTVTYFDLLNSQALLVKLTGQRDATFDRLIASKAKYLKGIGVSVPSSISEERLVGPSTEPQIPVQTGTSEDRLP